MNELVLLLASMETTNHAGRGGGLTLYITADSRIPSMVNRKPTIGATASQCHFHTTSMTMLTKSVVITITATTTTPAQQYYSFTCILVQDLEKVSQVH